MPKDKERNVTNALQARFTSYKVTKKRLEEMKTENKLFNSQVSDNHLIEKLQGWRDHSEGTDREIERRNYNFRIREADIYMFVWSNI